MVDSNNKIFAWQLIISVGVGVFWGILWALGDETGDFFFDLPLGVLWGFIGGLVFLILLAIVGGLIWALVRTITDKPEGGFGSTMTTNLDDLSGSSIVQSYNSTINSWRRSGIAWGVAWGLGSALTWALIAAIIWSSGVATNVGIAVALIIGIVVGVVMNLGYGVASELPAVVGEGYTWMENVLGRTRTVFRRKRPTWEFGAVAAFGMTGLLAFIVPNLVLGIFTFLFILLGAFIGMMVKALMEAS